MAQFTRDRITEYLYTVVQVLNDKGGILSLKHLLSELENRLHLSPEETSLNKSGYPRWVKVMQFASIGLVKVGWIKKNKGVWYLTDEGKDALKFEPKRFRDVLDGKYEEWASSSATASAAIITENFSEPYVESLGSRNFEQAEADAREEIKAYIKKLNPYEFQDLVAALFRGMGYFTPFIAPKGPDGGIDIVAYKDPIGAELPRIRIQVKHRVDNGVNRPEVQSLSGNLHREGYVGVLVSTGGFSKDALSEVRTSSKHIEKIDLDDFINLWEQYYEKMSDEDKALLPLRKISFLAPEDSL